MHLVSIRTTCFTQQRQWGLYQNKVNSSLAAIQRPGHWADNCKMVCSLYKLVPFITSSFRKYRRSVRFNVFYIVDPDNALYFMITLRWAKQHFKGTVFWASRILENSLQLSIRISNNTGSLYFFLPSHTAWLSNVNSNTNGWVHSNPKQAEVQYYLLREIRYVQNNVVNIDILCKFVEHATVKKTSLHPSIHGTVTVARHEGSCCRDMLQGHVAGTCCRDMSLQHVPATWPIVSGHL